MKKLLNKIENDIKTVILTTSLACVCTISFVMITVTLANHNADNFWDFVEGAVMAGSGQVALIILIARNSYIAGRKSCENSNQQKPA